MSEAPRDRNIALWRVQIQIPVPQRLIRRAGLEALGKYMAKALVKSLQTVPPDFVAKSAVALKKDLAERGLRLVGPDGREIGSDKPFKL